MVLSLGDLPEEILYNILLFCDAIDSVAVGSTARRFRGVTNEPLLWRNYCQTFSHFPQVADWKALYISRYLIDRATSRLFDSILANQTGRIEKLRSIINFGCDAKDTLLRNLSVDSSAEDYLARRYYAKALLTSLHRTIAIPEWVGLRNGDEIPLVNALGAFDLFIPESGFGNFDEINDRLEQILSRFRLQHPDFETASPRGKAGAIAAYLRAHNLTGIEPGREYHCLEHNFLGVALDDPGHNSLPLVSAVIYCHIAQMLGLNARPCGFPFHVHVIVVPPWGFDIDGNNIDTQGEPIYMDPFRSDQETPTSDMRTQLNFLGASPIEQSAFMGESRTSEIVLRCSKNILNSVQRTGQSSAVDVGCARYAALWSSLLLSSQPDIQQLLWLLELVATDFPSDVHLVERYIAATFRGTPEFEHILESLHVIRAVDEIPKQVKRRSSEEVSFRVGQVFRHRRYNYTAIVTGWDAECGAGEQWMRRMGIDHLQSGRQQSFYHVIVEDKSVRTATNASCGGREIL
ncbi:uncharacterized protein DSM5745_10779 [Aspergillus mulundensis]|uniref:F-box domain-containing protein n=1 Tax=Aspergillus mulundensis TaxID=1810919 RepID=A0A3D8QHT9_9EURO|nr:Uncharacterized protein DSM5745_10779 [Aspergillus mulundensis]RDW61281.1 Uncharacterized protein DSM5745_10779 [Aspergillus mulundensis]